jgi:hypothetical protein
MYLQKAFYIGAQHEWNDVSGTVEIYTNGKKVSVELKDIDEVLCKAAYWRKVNQIHAWFVKNVQEGVDDCKRYSVARVQLKELIDICKKVLTDHTLAETLLPTQSGFFFGSTGYDECYFKDIEGTVHQLEQLDLSDEGECYYYYQSSW